MPSSVAAPGRLVKLAATRARSRRWVGSEFARSSLGSSLGAGAGERCLVALSGGAVWWRCLVALSGGAISLPAGAESAGTRAPRPPRTAPR